MLFAEAGFVAYVTNTVFPDPLSEAEEAGFVEGLLRGDQEARSVLIERNLRLVAHIAKKFEGTGEDPDDLISIGTIGLIKAVNTFDPSKGTKLATYAAKCIENDKLKSKPSGILCHQGGRTPSRGRATNRSLAKGVLGHRRAEARTGRPGRIRRRLRGERAAGCTSRSGSAAPAGPLRRRRGERPRATGYHKRQITSARRAAFQLGRRLL